MAHCVFMHKADSIYDDIPAERYQFPAQYLGRAEPSISDWIICLEPRRVANSRGYFAVAKVEKIVPDPTAPGVSAIGSSLLPSRVLPLMPA
jgi:putative restriction endonuclease